MRIKVKKIDVPGCLIHGTFSGAFVWLGYASYRQGDLSSSLILFILSVIGFVGIIGLFGGKR